MCAITVIEAERERWHGWNLPMRAHASNTVRRWLAHPFAWPGWGMVADVLALA